MSATGVRPNELRVAIVIPSHWDYRMGGSQYQAKLLIEQIHKDHGATIAYFTARASANRRFVDHHVICVGHSNALRRFGHFWDYFRLQRALREFAPHVIYQRVGCAYTGIVARYARRSGTPLIWHLASENDCRKAPAVSELLVRPHAFIETHLAKKGAVHADIVVAQSEDQIMMLRENFGRQADRMIRNFHPLPQIVDKRADRFTVVWIANLKAVKRPELFLEIASLVEDLPDIDFVMLGREYASDSLQGEFDQAMRTRANVRYMGAVPNDEVNNILDRSHLLINTSKSEGFSNTFIQAWMRSVPVLTLGVNPDGLLADSFLGRSHDSTAGVASSIRELASSIDRLNDMGKKSRQYAIDNFSMNNAVELADLVVGTATDNRDKNAGRPDS